MNMILVTYDLRKPGRDYSALYKLLKSAGNWARIAESVWMLKTEFDCAAWRDKIKQVVDANDLVFVIEVKQHWAASNLSDEVTNWLKNPSNWR